MCIVWAKKKYIDIDIIFSPGAKIEVGVIWALYGRYMGVIWASYGRYMGVSG